VSCLCRAMSMPELAAQPKRRRRGSRSGCHVALGERLRCETFDTLPRRVLRALLREWAEHLTPEGIETDTLRDLVVYALNVDRHLRLPQLYACSGHAEPLKAVLRKRYDEMGRRLAGATMQNYRDLGYFTFIGPRATCTVTGLQFTLPLGATSLMGHADWVIRHNSDFGRAQLAVPSVDFRVAAP
jgi:hypothetical protein